MGVSINTIFGRCKNLERRVNPKFLEPPYVMRKEMFNKYLSSKMAIDIVNLHTSKAYSISRRDLGCKVHVFSHRKHHMYVEEIRIYQTQQFDLRYVP